jgi:hypothetical protein
MREQQSPKHKQSLNEQEIVEILSDLDLTSSNYWLVMGAALVMHGVRDMTSDVDLAVSDDLFRHFTEAGCVPLLSKSGRSKVVLRDYVTAYKNWTPSSWTTVRGVQVASLESIIEEKALLARQKDLSDIDAIRGYRALRRPAGS